MDLMALILYRFSLGEFLHLWPSLAPARAKEEANHTRPTTKELTPISRRRYCKPTPENYVGASVLGAALLPCALIRLRLGGFVVGSCRLAGSLLL